MRDEQELSITLTEAYGPFVGIIPPLGVLAVHSDLALLKFLTMNNLFSSFLLPTTVALSPLVSHDGKHTVRRQDSPQWKKGRFRNIDPIRNQFKGIFRKWMQSHPNTIPKHPIPVVHIDPESLRSAPETGLRLTWLGHSSSFLEIDGLRILIDPVWSEFTSPVPWAGPHRWFSPLISLQDLPSPDLILISHNHYDHMDRKTIQFFRDSSTRFIVPLGLAKTLKKWGIPSHRISELDWWNATMIQQVRIVATPTRHASGRFLFDQNKTLWCGFAIQGPNHRVYYSGDTGPMHDAEEIGYKLGPFDLTLIECGQYDSLWPDWHMSPQHSIKLHQSVRGKTMVPVHWGLFKLAFHAWNDPPKRITKLASEQGAHVLIPKPGESIEPKLKPDLYPWWD